MTRTHGIILMLLLDVVAGWMLFTAFDAYRHHNDGMVVFFCLLATVNAYNAHKMWRALKA